MSEILFGVKNEGSIRLMFMESKKLTLNGAKTAKVPSRVTEIKTDIGLLKPWLFFGFFEDDFCILKCPLGSIS